MRSPSTPLPRRCARGARAGSARWCLREQIKPVRPDADTAHVLAQGLVGLGIGRLPWSKAALQLRNRVRFLRRAEGDEWPDLSDDGAGAQRRGLAGAAARRQDRARADSAPTISSTRSTHLLPWNLRKRLDAEAPTHFTAPTGSAVPIDYDAEQGPTRIDPRAGIVRACRASGDCRRPRAAGDRIAVAGAPAGAGDARSARLLARQLCRRQSRDDAAAIRAIPGRTIRSQRRRRAAPSRAAAKIAVTALTLRSPSGCKSRRVKAALLR